MGYRIKGVPEDQAEIIVCENNFHGRTITIVGFSTDKNSREGFGPFTPGFKIIPFGNATALREAITPNTVGFMVEPIQGEAGVIIPLAGYLKDVRAICDRHNVVLIMDEIQTGLGRTGKILAEEQSRSNTDRKGPVRRFLSGVRGFVQHRSDGCASILLSNLRI
jgi:ornithine--oxo-acid transaminase